MWVVHESLSSRAQFEGFVREATGCWSKGEEEQRGVVTVGSSEMEGFERSVKFGLGAGGGACRN